MEFFKQILGDDVLTPQVIDATYEWRMNTSKVLFGNERQVSDILVIGKDSYTLELTKSLPKMCLSVKLIQVKPREPASKFLCSAGLVDCYGKLRHFVRKEVELGKGCESKELLNIPMEVLSVEVSYLLRNGSISVQLTISLPTEHEWLTPCSHYERSLTSLSRDMGKLLEDKTDSDITFKVGDTVFKAHRLILSARSPVFAQMFDRNTSCSSSSKKRSEDTFDIKGVDSSVFGHVLRYIYTDQVDGALTPGTAVKLIEAAERYRLHSLKRSCVSFLATNLTIENVCETILLVEKSSEKRLEEAVHKFVYKKAYEILRSEQWEKFKAKNTAIANSVLSSILLSKKAT